MTVEESRHEEEYVAAVAEKDAGNKHFSAGEYERAKGSYLLALNLLQDGGNPVVTREANDLACKLHTNAAAVFIKLGDPLSAIEHCKLALAIDKRNVKALFRRAECLKSLGHYSEALVQLERALLIEENNEEIKESMDECEDLLEFQEHAETFEGEDLGAAQSPAAGDGSDRRELPEDVLLALESKISGLRDEVLGGRAEVDEHVMLNHGESKFGMIEIKDAFMGPSNLSSALQFVRGQHLTATAKFAFVIVQKSKMLYPNVWWAHPWPLDDRDKDGIFVEAHTRECHATWFIPLEESGDSVIPQREIRLHQTCKLLLDESVFP